MATAEFDPYHKWLGIPPAEQPPNYYRLLGVAQLETDADVIANAADQRMSHLRTFQGGQNSNLSQKILNQVAAAKVCLLNPEKKAAYDEKVRAKLNATPAAPPPASDAMGAGPAVAVATVPAALAPAFDLESVLDIPYEQHGPNTSHSHSSRSQVGKGARGKTGAHASTSAKSGVLSKTAAHGKTKGAEPKAKPRWLIPAAIGALLIAGIGTGAVIALTGGDPKPQPSGPIASTDNTLNVAIPGGAPSTETASSVSSGSETTTTPSSSETGYKGLERVAGSNDPPARSTVIGENVPPVGSTTPLKPPPIVIAGSPPNGDPAAESRFKSVLNAFRGSLVNRDRNLSGRISQDLTRFAVTPEQIATAERIAAVHGALASFWDAVDAGIMKVEPPEEIQLGDETVILTGANKVATNPTISLRGRGSSWTFSRNIMPVDVALFFATRNLNGRSPTDQTLIVGAFHSFDKFGNRQLGHSMLNSLGSSHNIAQKLIPEFEADYKQLNPPSFLNSASGSRSSTPGAPRTPSTPSSPSTPAESTTIKPIVVAKLPLPEAAALKTAQDLMRDIFKDDFAAAGKSRASRLALSKKLMQQGSDTRDDAVAQFALLRESALLAGESGDAAGVESATDAIAEKFDISPLQYKVAALSKVKEAEVSPLDLKALLEAELEMADDAVSSSEFDLATQLLTSGLGVARKKMPSMTQAFVSKLKEIKTAEQAFAEVKVAIDKLATTPDDPAANTIVGRYYCLEKDDTAKGLPLLKKGADAKLRELATKELAEPGTPEDKIALADAWWDMAEGADAASRRLAHARAVHWYEQVLPSMEGGLSKAKVEKRLGTIKTATAAASGSSAKKPPFKIIRGVAAIVLDPSKPEFKRLWNLTNGAVADAGGVHIATPGAAIESKFQLQGDARIVIKFNSVRYGYYSVSLWGQTFDFTGPGALTVGIYRSGDSVVYGRLADASGTLESGAATMTVSTGPSAPSLMRIQLRQTYTGRDTVVQGIDIRAPIKNVVLE